MNESTPVSGANVGGLNHPEHGVSRRKRARATSTRAQRCSRCDYDARKYTTKASAATHMRGFTFLSWPVTAATMM